MKKIEIEKVVKEVAYYEAKDGTRFNTEEACKKYEESYKCMLNEWFNSIPKETGNSASFFFQYGNEEDEAYILIVRDEADVKKLNALFLDIEKTTRVLDPSHIGKAIMINFGWERDWVEWHVVDEYIAMIQKHFALCIEKLKKGDEANA